jgi:hypothetical protein
LQWAKASALAAIDAWKQNGQIPEDLISTAATDFVLFVGWHVFEHIRVGR